MKYFIFECGCKFHVGDAKRDCNGKIKCTKHKADIKHGEIHCKCGEIVIVNKRGMKSEFCKKCARLNRKKLDGERRKLLKKFPDSYKFNDNIVNMTYEEISKEIGISRERVRQIEAEALNKIRKRIHRFPALKERLEEMISYARVANSYYERNPMVNEDMLYE